MQVFVSTKYKVIYLRQPKSSSSSILAAMHKAFCGGGVTCAKEELDRMRKFDHKMWASFFVFTAVRNPYARMVSAYNMFSSYLRVKDPKRPTKRGTRCITPFEEFARDSYVLRQICETNQCCGYLSSRHQYVSLLSVIQSSL